MAYVYIMGASLLVAVMAFSMLTLARLNLRTNGNVNDAADAEVLAESAVEHCLTTLNQNSNWRTTYQNNVKVAPIALGRGSFTWKLVDEVNGTLASGPARLYGYGSVGSAVRVYSVIIQPTADGSPVLMTAAHAAQTFQITQSNVTLNATGGSLSTNSNFITGGVINGNIEATGVISGSGTVNGTQTLTPAKVMPPGTTIWSLYLAKSQPITWSSGQMNLGTVTPVQNPAGSPSADGVYYIKVPASSKLAIDATNITGTLMVEMAGGSQFQIGPSVNCKPNRPDYPTILVKQTSTDQTEFDSDTGYAYSGVLHVIGGGNLLLGRNFNLHGVVISEGTIQIGSTTAQTITLNANPLLFNNPPQGYAIGGSGMSAVANSWQWLPYQ